MIKTYSQHSQCQAWLEKFRGKQPLFACVLGFTATGLIPGISAAGATPADRQYTAIADAEFLYNGPQPNPTYPLPPLQAGASPVLISRAVLHEQAIPLQLFNAGLPQPPSVPAIDLQGTPARCLSQGNALVGNASRNGNRPLVDHLFQQGYTWGKKLARQADYLILGECVVGGTTTALALLTALGWDALGKVNSSHPTCNHPQKWAIVQQGIQAAGLTAQSSWQEIAAAIADPMQIVVAGMAIAASPICGVLLAGGTQMLAIYALIQAITHRATQNTVTQTLHWQPQQVMVGTTRWVAEDPTGDTVGLAKMLQAPLIATQLNFAQSQYPSLQAYEQGFVKEGVGAGGCGIAAHLYQNWNQTQLLQAIESIAAQLEAHQISKQPQH